MRMFFNRHQKRNNTRGFTAIELVVVIAIFGVLSSVVLIRFSTFTDGVNLFNTAQDIALRIKQAQNSAILGQYPRSPGQNILIEDSVNWKPKYGVFFDLTEQDTHDRFWVFFDEDNDNMFKNANDGSACISTETECIDEILIGGGQQEIYRLCVGDDCSHEKVALMFQRPFPDLVATDNDDQGGAPTVFTEDIRIILKSGTGSEISYRMITVTPLGQISVKTATLSDITGGGTGGTDDIGGN